MGLCLSEIAGVVGYRKTKQGNIFGVGTILYHDADGGYKILNIFQNPWSCIP